MKTRILFAALTVAMVAAVFCLPVLGTTGRDERVRYHQHMEEPGYTPCEDHGDEVFCTHLPIVVIDTEGQEIPGAVTGEADRFAQPTYTKAEDGSDYINVSVAVIDNAEGNNHLTDKADFTTRSLFRIRGNSSRRFEKSPYLMKFVDENGLDNDIEVMGMDAHHEWALHGPYLDKSLVRNYMWYNIAGEMMDYAPNVRYCEVFLNGEYRGLYLMTETITNGGPNGGRLDLSETVKDNELSGYLLRIDRATEEELETTRDIYVFTERTEIEGADVAVRYPGKSKLTPELARQIELDFSAFEKALFSYDHDTEDYGYWNWIDVDNFVDYWLLNEFTANQDALSASTFFYKTPGEKLKLCVWDFNNSCDNYIRDEYGNDMFFSRGFLFVGSTYYAMLFRDETFAEKVIDRYRELRKSYFSDEYLTTYIDETLAFLGPAVARNEERWADAFATDMLQQQMSAVQRNMHSTKEAAEYLKEWLKDHAAWVDEYIDVLNFYAHPSTHKKWEH